MSEAALNRRAIQRIFVVATAGMLLLLFDFFVGFDTASLQLMRGGDSLYLIRPSAGSSAGHIRLKADIKTDTGTVSKNYDLRLYPYAGTNADSGDSGGRSGSSAAEAGAMSEEELLAYEMRSVISSLNDYQSVRRVALPDRLRTGERIRWTAPKQSNTVVIAFGMILLIVLLYVRRLDPLEKLRRVQMDSVRRQLPEFVNRLVLLLQAGLVLNTAFEKSVEECIGSPDRGSDYFCKQMGEIYEASHKTNASMTTLFRSFAKESGMRELLRLSNIMEDNLHKGAALNAKLEAESENLWIERKKICEEKGRLTETTMLLPLFMFLIALIMITAAPAIIEL